MSEAPRKRKQTAAAVHWRSGEIIDASDGGGGSSSPWTRILAVLALVWLFDLVLGHGMTPADNTPTPEDRRGLRRVLRRAADDPGRSVLLIGDSVMAGDVMAGRVQGWEQQRVIDHMAAELAPEAALGLHQIALDGMLPIDIEHVVAELDRVDPEGRVEVVLELNLRYFSAAYAEQQACSREVLCELAPMLAPGSQGTLDYAWRGLAEGAGWLDDVLLDGAPVHRRRVALGERPRLDTVYGLAVPRASDPADAGEVDAGLVHAQAQAAGRVLEHYRSATVAGTGPANAQVAALRRTLSRLHDRGRRSLIFVTPLADGFAEQATPGPKLGALHSQLGALVHDFADPRLRFVDLDHPLFVEDLFIDHCHLWPSGNRLLALNLLHELSAPMRSRPPEAAMVVAEDVDQTLVSRVDQGYAEGAAWQALFDAPDGIDTNDDGSWIVVADTQNHMLRQLRGHMRVVEPLAGKAGKRGGVDGSSTRAARLYRPRHPTILADAVVFIDGLRRERVRIVDHAKRADHGRVRTLTWAGPRCTAYRRLRARDGVLYMLCDDGRLLSVGLDVQPGADATITGEARELLTPFLAPAWVRGGTVEVAPAEVAPNGATADEVTGPTPSEVTRPTAPARQLARAHRFDVAPGGRLFFSDQHQRIWAAKLTEDGGALAGEPQLAFSNTSASLLPWEDRETFPFDFDQLGLAAITDLRWVERYGGLLIADEHPLAPKKADPRIHRELSERVHLRFFDLEAEQIYPWVKPIPHGEAYALWNARANAVVSYFHRGSYVVAQKNASLIWVERDRSRLFRLSDGLLGLIKFGNRNGLWAKVELYDTIANVAPDAALAAFRPDRYFDDRTESFARGGPYLGVMVGSSLTTLVDRIGNYSLGRRLELELQRELGYRDNLRFDLFQRTAPSASLKSEVGMVDKLVSAGLGFDVIFVEINDHGGRFLRDTPKRKDWLAQLSRLERLASKSGALVILFDNTALDADGRDGLRASAATTHELLEAGRMLGFLVLEPSDRMLRDLLVESPWGTQPWGHSEHHGAPYAIDRTAEVLAALSYPRISRFLAGREPARRRPLERGTKRGKRLADAFEGLDLELDALPAVVPTYLQQTYDAGHVQVFVDLAGFPKLGRSEAELERIAAAVLIAALDGEAYGQLASKVTVTLVEFDNYDEYGEGVLESATTQWSEDFKAATLAKFLGRVAAP
ncbi:hypothetical protein DB30_07440 [Enhygromyxa salina]|uniref:Uncharacterized protein n=1 Tax=Enhygromyxa salina TaxID=215803 RepID=A0A0C2D164_9BACT|nr:hypothetical protein [Enhygromyxa salina]KIG13887.1 hypothetical protein DB30_07440 [Enhygromyxa salina]